MRALRGLQLPDPGLPALGAEGMAALEDNNDVPGPDDHLPPAALHHAAVAATEVNFAGIIVRYDNWSHSSGERRAYAMCGSPDHRDAHGNPCSKYRQCNQFPNQQAHFAWLVAWLEGGKDLPSRETHKLHIPTAAEIDVVLSRSRQRT